jgi:hypothetical protein
MSAVSLPKLDGKPACKDCKTSMEAVDLTRLIPGFGHFGHRILECNSCGKIFGDTVAKLRLRICMSHYYFDLKDGETKRDRSGLDCADDAAAIVKANMIASEVTAVNGDNWRPDLHISIIHEDGHEVSRIPVLAPFLSDR